MNPPKTFLDFLGQLFLKSREIEVHLQSANRNSNQEQVRVHSSRKKVNLNANLGDQVAENIQTELRSDKKHTQQQITQIQQNYDNISQNNNTLEAVRQTQELQDLNQIPESIIIHRYDKSDNLTNIQMGTQPKLKRSKIKNLEKPNSQIIQNIEIVNNPPTNQVKPNDQDQISDIILDLDQEPLVDVNIVKDKDKSKKQIIKQLSDLKPKRKTRTVLKKIPDSQDNQSEVKFMRQVRDDQLSISYSSTSSEIVRGPYICTNCGYKSKSKDQFDTHRRKCFKNDTRSQLK